MFLLGQHSQKGRTRSCLFRVKIQRLVGMGVDFAGLFA